MNRILLILSIGAAGLISCGKNENIATADSGGLSETVTPVTPSVPPPAGFSVGFRIDDSATVKEGTGVQFRNLSTGAVSYKWDFGNGQTLKEKDPLYTYPACGTYQVKLSSFDANGVEKVATQEVVINCIFTTNGKHSEHDPLF